MSEPEKTTAGEGTEDFQNEEAPAVDCPAEESQIDSPITTNQEHQLPDSTISDDVIEEAVSLDAPLPDDSQNSTGQESTSIDLAPTHLDSVSLKSLIRKSSDKTSEEAFTETKELEVVGQVLNDSFAIVDVIGRGEASVVFSAMDLENDLTVAIKTPKRVNRDTREKFKEAALIHGKLKHPNIAKIRCYLESPSGIPYLVLENLQGASLKELFDSMKSIEEEEMVAVIVSQICDALEYAHSLNVVHGKLSPGNIFLTEQDERLCVKVVDFAVADALARTSETAGSETKESSNSYQSPEKSSSMESDIYSLGVITYQLVAGRLPSMVSSPGEESQLTSLASFRPDLPCIRALDQVLADALEQNPDWRLNSAASFKEGIEDWIAAARRERCQQAVLHAASETSGQHVIPDSMPSGITGDTSEPAPAKSKSKAQVKQSRIQYGLQIARDKMRTTLHNLVALAQQQPVELGGALHESTSLLPPTPVADFDAGSLVGQLLFDSYAVLRVLKDGPNKITYLAKHFDSGKRVVLKTVRNRALIEAFGIDVGAQEALKHPHIVEHLEYLESPDGIPFTIEEYVEGISLAELLTDCGRVESEEDLARIFSQIIDAIAYAHELGIVHGNLKPSNILFNADAETDTVRIKVLDFGPAKAQAELALAQTDEALSSKLDFNFMSPEQVLHGIFSFNSDVYTMARLFYMMATGTPTHNFSTLNELKNSFNDDSAITFDLSHKRQDLRAVNELNKVLETATVTDHANRLQSVADFKEGIYSWIDEMHRQRSEEQHQLNLEAKRQRTQEVVKQTIYNLVALRQQQLDQEQTVLMKFASATATGGPRQSPIKSATKLVSLIVVVSLTCVVSAFYVLTNFEQLKSAWSNASLTLAELLSGHPRSQLEDEFALVDEPINKAAKKPKAANKAQLAAGADQSTSSPPVGAPIQRRTRFNYAESSDYAQYAVKTKFGDKRLDEPPLPGETPPPSDPANQTPPRSSQVYSSELMSKWANRMKVRSNY